LGMLGCQPRPFFSWPRHFSTFRPTQAFPATHLAHVDCRCERKSIRKEGVHGTTAGREHSVPPPELQDRYMPDVCRHPGRVQVAISSSSPRRVFGCHHRPAVNNFVHQFARFRISVEVCRHGTRTRLRRRATMAFTAAEDQNHLCRFWRCRTPGGVQAEEVFQRL
jgi:hypothetical protein